MSVTVAVTAELGLATLGQGNVTHFAAADFEPIRLSRPASRLPMFFLCRQMSSALIVKTASAISSVPLNIA